MRRTLSVVLFLALAVPAWGQDGIKVSGRYTILVESAPFTLTAPPGGALYFWRLPDGWAVTDANDSVTVTRATEGPATVTVTVVFIDFKTEKVEKKTHALNLTVGKAPPPPGPDPPKPDPETPLARSLKAAWAAESAPDPRHLASLAALYRQAVTTAGDAGLKTAGDLYRVLREASVTLLPAAALPRVRTAIADYLKANLPTAAEATLDAATRQRAAAAFGAIADSLGAIQ